MFELLARLFVRDYKNVKSPTVRRAYGMLVSIVGIVLNLILAAGKLVVGILSGSLSVEADAVNNLSDAGAALVALICFRISAKPADRDHPYGHARIEYVASMIVSFLILLVGFELLKESVTILYASVVTPDAVEKTAFSWVTVAVLGVSVFGKLFLAAFNRAIGKRIDSAVMRAASADSLSDVLSTTAVLVAAVVAHYVALPFSLDGAMGVAVSALILVAGGKILLETKNSILGEAPDEETVKAIEELVAACPLSVGMHDLSVHKYGAGNVIASLHVEVDGKGDIFEAHDAIDNIERELWQKLRVRATVHLDPIVVGDPVVDAMHAEAAAAARSVDARITVHDFRMVRGTTHSNLIFDVAVPFECTLSDREIIAAIGEEIGKKHPDHYTVVSVDRV
ncbi:MAG: cation transporter [Ruminococcaceae bacterium]|nr:cation transporter [Oscillospiraceae bacterium]